MHDRGAAAAMMANNQARAILLSEHLLLVGIWLGFYHPLFNQLIDHSF